MRRFLPLAHLAFLLLGVWTGYASLDPEALRDANPDQYFALASLIVGAVFAVAATYIFGAGHATLAAPSLRRLPWAWWHDPLQALFVTTYSVGALAFGAALHLAGTSSTGFWLFASFLALFVGLLIGQVIAYALRRARITKA